MTDIHINTDEAKIDDLLSRSVSMVYPSKEFLKKELSSGRRLRMYIGADATGPQLHLGHATNFMLLEKFRKMGHEIIILFGDFTAMIGDPTDKEATRVALSEEQVNNHISSWKDQVGKIISFDDPINPAKILKNSEWLSKLFFRDILKIASEFTVAQMIERDMFQKRIKENKPIYLHEFLYPLMQGYDSVAMNVDVEVGGTDQTFNMLAGRILQKKYNNKEKFVISTTLLENHITGEKLMSKSQNNYIALNAEPNDMFGKVMALSDVVLNQVFVDCTHVALSEIDEIEKQISGGMNPRDAKIRLAKEIVTIYHGEKQAEEAEQNFEKTFAKGGVPDDVVEVSVAEGTQLVDVLLAEKIIISKNEWRRLVEEGAVTYMDSEEKITEADAKVTSGSYKVGKRRFLKIKVL